MTEIKLTAQDTKNTGIILALLVERSLKIMITKLRNVKAIIRYKVRHGFLNRARRTITRAFKFELFSRINTL